MSETLATDGPFTLEMKVGFTDGDGTTATAVFDLPPGVVPTDEQVKAAIAQCEKQVKEMQPSFHLQTRHEFVQELFAAQFAGPVSLAVPGPDTFRL